MSDEVLIEELRAAMRADVEHIQVPPQVIAEILESPRRARPNLGWLMPALAVAVAAAVAVVAVTSLTHRSPPPRSSSAVPVAARHLAARLAVLRRPQRPQDVLPRWAVRETESLTFQARVVTQLSRLVGAVNLGQNGRARVYLVVQRPPRFPLHPTHVGPPQLAPRLGDRATIAFVGPFREEAAINGPTVAAGGEQVAASRVGIIANPGQFTDLWGAIASIVPDGVKRVKWVFGVAGQDTRRIVVWPKLRDNMALGRVPFRLQVYMREAVWYGRDGRVIASFGSASNAVGSARFKRALEASLHERVDPSLLAHFSVLRRAHLGYPGLDFAEASALIEPNPLGLNTGRERFVVDPRGPAKVFVVPGRRGIALRYVSPMVGQAEGETSLALSGGLFIEGARSNGHRTIIGLAPDGNRTVRILLGDGRSRGAAVVDNVYAVTVPVTARWLLIRNSSGRRVRLRLG